MRTRPMTIAAELADFLTSTAFDDLPALPVERAKMVIASTLASASPTDNAATIHPFAR